MSTASEMKAMMRQDLIEQVVSSLVNLVEEGSLSVDPEHRYGVAEKIVQDMSTHVVMKILSGMVESDASTS